MLWAIGIGFVACTVGFALGFVRSQRGSRTPPSPIASAPEGVPIVVRGRVSTPAPLRAPCTGRPCVYYRIELRVWSGNTVDTSVAGEQVDFTLRDDSGTARVLVDRARFEIVADIFEMDRASRLADASRALIAKLGWSLPEIARVELCEAAIEVDSTIDVRGIATREPDPAPPSGERDYRGDAPTVLVFESEHTIGEAPRERRFIGRSAARP
ncbi:MAG TPA: hypothetical protein VLB44_19675 [Kofleriaceae bacterium]|nr:hypothetical protein [Kofleriaceae bacterium]